MDEEYIKGLIGHLEELGASQEIIDELVVAMEQNVSHGGTQAPIVDDTALIREKINSEPDWRRRASMAAGIISKNLDNGY